MSFLLIIYLAHETYQYLIFRRRRCHGGKFRKKEVFKMVSKNSIRLWGPSIGSFLMLYLTNIVGMNSGIVGTLMLVARLFDGVSDVLFGTLVDRTHSKMGKARPWMFGAQFGVSILLIMLFSIPVLSASAQYAYFFVVYVALNGIFYTANNIAYASLTSLITRNPNERVQIEQICL